MTDQPPTHGWTKHGTPVHSSTHGYLSNVISLKGLKAEVDKVEGFNAKLAVTLTRGVGTMAMAYLFCLIALASLPAILSQTGWFPKGTFPHFLTSPSLILVVAWIAQTFLQLVLLSVIMVGQSVQSVASDARATKTFEDTQVIVDRLDTKTMGGLKEVLDRLAEIEARLPATPTSDEK
ncbi:MAG: hypothetical protein ACYC1I_02655 [Acidimicrobiales bacterium]